MGFHICIVGYLFGISVLLLWEAPPNDQVLFVLYPILLHVKPVNAASSRASSSRLKLLFNACIVSRSPQRLAKMMEVIVEVCRAFALTVSAKKTETMCMPPPRTPRTMVRIEAAGQIYKHV